MTALTGPAAGGGITKLLGADYFRGLPGMNTGPDLMRFSQNLMASAGLGARFDIGWPGTAVHEFAMTRSVSTAVEAAEAIKASMAKWADIPKPQFDVSTWSGLTSAPSSWAVTHALEELNGVMGRQLHGMAAMVGGLPRQNLWLDGLLLGGSEDSIVGIMRSWSALADRGDRLCRLALRMALAAKDAVLRGDVAAVERFVREWLGFKRVTEPLVDAASSVLIETSTPGCPTGCRRWTMTYVRGCANSPLTSIGTSVRSRRPGCAGSGSCR